ncbi:MAG: hypothetical protein RJA44_860 [Pseudomonadota bacterium]
MRRAATLAAMLALAGCGGSTDEGPAPSCSAFAGVWSVAADYGNGLIARQRWTISQQGCTLQLSADPADGNGPLLASATGGAGDGVFWASWIRLAGACRYVSQIDVTAAASGIFSGTLYWSRGSNGQGLCPGGAGQLAISGQR